MAAKRQCLDCGVPLSGPWQLRCTEHRLAHKQERIRRHNQRELVRTTMADALAHPAMTCFVCGRTFDGATGRAMFCTVECEAEFGIAHDPKDLWPCAFAT